MQTPSHPTSPTRRHTLRWLGAGLGSTALGACGGGAVLVWGETPASAASSPLPIDTQPAVKAAAVIVVSGLSRTWALTFLPDGRMLVTERTGALRIVGLDGKAAAPIVGVPAVDARGQGGLLDVALDPAFAANRRVYLSYAEAGTGAEAGRNGTAVARGVLSNDGTRLSDVQVIFRQTPKIDSTAHFGSRLVFAPDGTLFITLGDRFSQRDAVQDLSNTLGKVVRIHPDGSVPKDNPFVGRAGVREEIWSYGHRNVQGAALHPVTGELWTHEHGPQGGDEVNITRAGRNYGWPKISYGCEYGAPVGNCPPVGGATSAPGMEQPVTYWVPTSIAPCGMAFYTASVFPQWRGNLFVGALAGQALWRLQLDGNKVVSREALLTDLGERIRDVRQGPDGAIYLISDGASAKIYRLQPV
ncbi:Soluble aldose sugar dehydrogenase YliI [Thiomonas arsenitoxydans]|uniref:Soluble aldose sugar dehydrogenase YliI n=1 Tax=Thiomonas arsenitoxydans (strain DSM 22701 / CIP 110005 / 3As) TaxID=426114 RepID=D6CUF3_THIA3|nr:PQQ-dependent sugar dehydrogenase [Thiomonas arsenitoxydans]CAZ88922.1 Soluble aldose sugar dehydrogenase yliI precursor (Asd) [Thiomonas arsenitoxydans]CQR29373.1 Soluble aldose sugar dehydrogenase YliI [Thiomonas arsenitoxydans]CQR35041.1 Soluble aldose sugar dehydrogenase YliI [Thiomonas arsenitoxydans]CQR35815.1 Soluble aldose sugar dehydrogenase YliI [Thiomonas arsenitoxydans]CQR35887.1 Soluble aldose sugar dehydrogenase YliI [Thiomonas arsenitoxydans]